MLNLYPPATRPLSAGSKAVAVVRETLDCRCLCCPGGDDANATRACVKEGCKCPCAGCCSAKAAVAVAASAASDAVGALPAMTEVAAFSESQEEEILQVVREIQKRLMQQSQPQPQPPQQPQPQPCPVETDDNLKLLNGILTTPGAHLLNVNQLVEYKKIFPMIATACGVPERDNNVSVMTVIGNFDECDLYKTFVANCARVADEYRKTRSDADPQYVLLLHIDSPGGIVTTLQKMLGALNLLRASYPKLILATLCTAHAMSCGAVLFLQGQYRFADLTEFKAAETGGRRQRVMLGSSILIHAPFGKKEYTKRGEMIELLEIDQMATAVVYGGIDNAQLVAAKAYAKLHPKFSYMAQDGDAGRARVFVNVPVQEPQRAFDTWNTRKYIIPRTDGMSDQLLMSKEDIGAFMLRSHMDLVRGTPPPLMFVYDHAVNI